MRLERQPSLQLRESLNVCWERRREKGEGKCERIGRGDERVEKKSSGWREQVLTRERGDDGRWVYVHKNGRKSRTYEKKDGGRRRSSFFPRTSVPQKGGRDEVSEFQRCGNSLL